MSKKAMKLALEALEDTLSDDPYPYSLESKAITALREALAKPDFWEGYVPEPVKPATTETNGGKTGWPPGLLQDDCKGLSKWLSNKPDAKRRVREALDKKAENARELGLDYEPARDSGIVTAGGADPRTQRTWVGLSDLNIDELENNYMKSAQTAHEFLRAIEAKLKEKNT